MLNDIFEASRIKLDLESATKDEALEELVEIIALSDSTFNRRVLLESITRRESKMNTAIMPGIAVPHGYSGEVKGIIGAVGFSRSGIEYDNDGEPVHLVFLLLMDEKSREKHLRAFHKLLEFLRSTSLADIGRAGTPRQLYDLLCQY